MTPTGTATISLLFEGRFLKQEIRGQMMEDQPPFEGVGFTGYDNMRQEYQAVWFDNMATGMMRGTGRFDATAKAMTYAAVSPVARRKGPTVFTTPTFP